MEINELVNGQTIDNQKSSNAGSLKRLIKLIIPQARLIKKKK